MNKGPKNGKNWDSKKRAVVATPIYDYTKQYGVLEFESAGKAAQWVIDNNIPTSKGKETSKRRTTVASSITSTIKGRENRTIANKSRTATRKEAYGFAWAYKD